MNLRAIMGKLKTLTREHGDIPCVAMDSNKNFYPLSHIYYSKEMDVIILK